MAEARRAARSRRPERSRRARAPASDVAGSLSETWRRLGFEQRVATVAALLLIVSTIGPFSFVEAAVVLTAAGVLTLVKKRADRKEFHLPFGDGTVILAAGLWSGLLIVVRLFDRELGQSVLALVCAAILAGAGARERAKRPADDLPPPGADPDLPPGRGEPGPDLPPVRSGQELAPPARERRQPRPDPTARIDPAEDLTEQLSMEDAPPEERRGARASRPRRERDDG